MLKFITLSENKDNSEKYISIINKMMMNLDLYYEVYNFESESSEFINICEENFGTNIFIIEDSENLSAERLVRLIKKEYKMVAAFIVVVGKEHILSLNNLVFDYSFLIDVIKDDVDICINLENDIRRILNILEVKKPVLNVFCDKLLYRISFNDIYYIEKQLNGKKAIIVTKMGKFHLFKSLNELQEMLDDRFFRSHQSAIINIENVKVIDFEKNKIIFNDEIVCPLLSRSFKKQIRKVYTTKCG